MRVILEKHPHSVENKMVNLKVEQNLKQVSGIPHSVAKDAGFNLDLPSTEAIKYTTCSQVGTHVTYRVNPAQARNYFILIP